MTKIPKILVAGYGTWAKARNNPAQSVAQTLGARTWQDREVVGVVVPVETDKIADTIAHLLTQHKPDIWIGLGVSSAAIVQPEVFGINCRDFDVEDASGKNIHQQPIISGGPAAYQSSLPNTRMVEMMRAQGIPSAVSFHAGTHLCNQMLYTTEHMIQELGLNTISGFVHIPQTPRNIVESNANRASMGLEMSCEAVSLTIEASIHALGQHQRTTG